MCNTALINMAFSICLIICHKSSLPHLEYQVNQREKTSMILPVGLPPLVYHKIFITSICQHFFIMPQCVPRTVYETMNVHEQTKIVGLHAPANGLFLTLVRTGIKECRIKLELISTPVFFMSHLVCIYVSR